MGTNNYTPPQLTAKFLTTPRISHFPTGFAELLHFARVLIHPRYEEVQGQASRKDQSRENCSRDNCSGVACKEGFQSGAQQPDLDYEKNHNHGHRPVNGDKSATLFGGFEVGHISFP